MTVALLHPDLGIGGAERLVVDAALAMQRAGNKVAIYTAHHDPAHCFAETRDGTLQVTVYGDWLPRTIFGKLHVVCAYVRMLYLTMAVLLTTRGIRVFFVDQISVALLLLRLLAPSTKTIFYCHFPDQLLTTRSSLLKRLYRAPIDRLEEWSTGLADVVLVNSKFTAATFKNTFRRLDHITPSVLYPSLNFASFDKATETADEGLVPSWAQHVLLSINRFERKKDLPLALEALSLVQKELLASDRAKTWEGVCLVVAGGYDERVAENVEHYRELVDLAAKHNLGQHVVFVRSFSDKDKLRLLRRCFCLLYTPVNEHFGITPLEAMYMERPVIATNTGGPLETVRDGATGFLCPRSPAAFAEAIMKFVDDAGLATAMGTQARKHVQATFGFSEFQDQLQNHVAAAAAASAPTQPAVSRGRLLTHLLAPLTAFLVLAVALFFSLFA